MKDWKMKANSKKGKASRTAGKDKGDNCKATPLQKGFAKRSRSYKWAGYSTWLETKNGAK